jgi:hypothetical protein
LKEYQLLINTLKRIKKKIKRIIEIKLERLELKVPIFPLTCFQQFKMEKSNSLNMPVVLMMITKRGIFHK